MTALQSIVGGRILRSKSFYVHDLLPTLNEYTKASRGNIRASAGMKKRAEKRIMLEIYDQLRGWSTEKPVFLVFHWVEKNKRRDHDNVAFAKKFVQDAMVKSGVIQGDGWKHVVGFLDRFSINPEDPGVEVTILEVEDEQ